MKGNLWTILSADMVRPIEIQRVGGGMGRGPRYVFIQTKGRAYGFIQTGVFIYTCYVCACVLYIVSICTYVVAVDGFTRVSVRGAIEPHCARTRRT